MEKNLYLNIQELIKNAFVHQLIHAHYSNKKDVELDLIKFTDIPEIVREGIWDFKIHYSVALNDGRIVVRGDRLDSEGYLTLQFKSGLLSYFMVGRDTKKILKELGEFSDYLEKILRIFFPKSSILVKDLSSSEVLNAQSYIRREEAFREYSRAREFIVDRRFQNAFEALEKTLKRNPSHFNTYAPYWDYRGEVLDQLERYNEAIKSYKQSISLRETNCRQWHLIAQIYWKINDFKKAREIMEDPHKIPDGAYIHTRKRFGLPVNREIKENGLFQRIFNRDKASRIDGYHKEIKRIKKENIIKLLNLGYTPNAILQQMAPSLFLTNNLSPTGVIRPNCPYCNYEFDSMPLRKHKCPQCGQIFYSRRRASNGKKALLKESDLAIEEEQTERYWERICSLEEKILFEFGKFSCNECSTFSQFDSPEEIFLEEGILPGRSDTFENYLTDYTKRFNQENWESIQYIDKLQNITSIERYLKCPRCDNWVSTGLGISPFVGQKNNSILLSPEDLKELNLFCISKRTDSCISSPLLHSAKRIAKDFGITLVIIVINDARISEIIEYYQRNGFSLFTPIGEPRKTKWGHLFQVFYFQGPYPSLYK